MDSAAQARATRVWVLLLLATILSWWLGSDGSAADPNGHMPATVAVLVIAFVKVRFVVWYFMEARNASIPLRLLCDVWLIGVCLSIILLYSFRLW